MQFRHFNHIVLVSVFTSLWWPDLIWLGPISYWTGSIESSKLTKIWRAMKSPHFTQHIVFVSIFTRLWWPDLIWLGPILYWTGHIESSKLIEMWRKNKFLHFIRHTGFVSVFISLWWRNFIWLGSIFRAVGSIGSSRLIKMWRCFWFNLLCLYLFLQGFGSQISSDWERFFYPMESSKLIKM